MKILIVRAVIALKLVAISFGSKWTGLRDGGSARRPERRPSWPSPSPSSSSSSRSTLAISIQCANWAVGQDRNAKLSHGGDQLKFTTPNWPSAGRRKIRSARLLRADRWTESVSARGCAPSSSQSIHAHHINTTVSRRWQRLCSTVGRPMGCLLFGWKATAVLQIDCKYSNATRAIAGIQSNQWAK